MYFQFLTDEQNNTIIEAVHSFHGQSTTLESALGAIVMGQVWGWRFLKITHSPATYKKYEKILGIRFQDICPERGELADKSIGIRIADKLNSFWAVATGKRKVPNKAKIGTEAEIQEALKDVE